MRGSAPPTAPPHRLRSQRAAKARRLEWVLKRTGSRACWLLARARPPARQVSWYLQLARGVSSSPTRWEGRPRPGHARRNGAASQSGRAGTTDGVPADQHWKWQRCLKPLLWRGAPPPPPPDPFRVSIQPCTGSSFSSAGGRRWASEA
eukprot:scaffold2544_cov401-Prasinococcus_capsulatus_cf.AAC.17